MPRKPPAKPADDLQDDWQAIRPKGRKARPEAAPDLTKALQAIKGLEPVGFCLELDGVSGGRIASRKCRTLQDAERGVLEILGERVRHKIFEIRREIQDHEVLLDTRRKELAAYEAALPYLAPEPEPEPSEGYLKPELNEDDDLPF